jgi:prepilin-type N-terminal cleavage/methylation domain-containing protein
MKKTKGFTLVELLVVIAIIALLMGILMPALARVRAIAFRMVCGTNLSGIGKAMLIYANDYDNELPRAGNGASPSLARQLPEWTALDRLTAFGASPGRATLTSSFYLLVKYAEVTPKSFICKSDSSAKEFKRSFFDITDKELVDLWDFGTTNGDAGADGYCSYSYHHPYCVYALTTSSDPGMAVAADRNPWVALVPAASTVTPGTNADWTDYCNGIGPGDSTLIKGGNAIAHQRDGQNVLFVDSHVSFEKSPASGVDDDNIYTRVSGAEPDKRIGDRTYGEPVDRLDSFLIGNGMGGGGAIR